MKIHELLERDPRKNALANTGQARIVDRPDERARAELRAELETFVCDGQYGAALERILRGYLTHVDRPRQVAAWVSGFFGSGKSHLLKMLAHLWVDTPFPDGSTARTLVRSLPPDVVAALRELDTLVKRSGRPAIAAAGTLPAGRSDDVRLTVLAIVLRAAGLPESYPQAQFCFWLREHGHLDSVRAAVERSGRDWLKELGNLYVSPVISQAVLVCDPNFARDEREARQVLRAQFPDRAGDITTAEFLAAVRKALSNDSTLPSTIIVLDEVQQYIGDDSQRATTVTDLAEAVAVQLDSRVLLVASGQAALTATPQLQKLRDRFRITAQLSDTDVETVTRKVLLQKKQSALPAAATLLDKNAGEISRHLQGSRLQERTEDRKTRDADYPLLPTRRRFWEEVFRSVDKAGNHSQLRSQLRILHDALHGIADRELGVVIAGDVLFDAVAGDLVNSGVLPNELHHRIRALANGSDSGRLRQRLAGLVFLVHQLPRSAGLDTGMRANSRMLADLLVEDVSADSGPFRQQVAAELDAMAANGTLLKIEDEFHLQTTEGAEWERSFKERVAALQQRGTDLPRMRDEALAAEVQAVVGEQRIVQGAARKRRQLVLHARADDPPAETERITVWLRSGWDATQKSVEDDARKRGHDDPIVHVFIPKRGEDELRTRIAEVAAGRELLAEKGAPSSTEGQQAQASMRSRLAASEQAQGTLVRDLVANARVLQGGGNEIHGESLAAKLATAAESAVTRLFPRFQEADGDLREWGNAITRARDGSDAPFRAFQWDRPVEEHPVARELLARIGNGRRGTDLRRDLQAPPFGWPEDAIDATLLALHRTGTLRATLNGQTLAPGQLDQAKLKSAEFRTERVKLGTEEKLQLRGLFQKLSIHCKSGEEELRAPQFLDALHRLAESAGGSAPLPVPPATTSITDLRRQAGSEQLAALLQRRTELEQSIAEWHSQANLANARRPAWEIIETLLRHAVGLAMGAELAQEVTAIRSQRSLLAAADPLPLLLGRLTTALRASLTDLADRYATAFAAAEALLAADAAWQRLAPADRVELLARHALIAPAAPRMKSDDELCAELDRLPLAARESAVAALPERVRAVLAEAVQRLQPKARRVALRPATLHSEGEIDRWLAEQRQQLAAALRDGPVIVG